MTFTKDPHARESASVGEGANAWEASRGKFDETPGANPEPDSVDDGPQFISAHDIIEEKPRDEIVESMAHAGGICVIVGESGAGKTFLAQDIAAAIADGRNWHGRRTERGSIAYVSFEGDALSLRLEALKNHGASLEDFYILRASDPISPRIGRDGIEEPSIGETFLAGRLQRLAFQLREQGKPPLNSVFIDTVRQSLSGSEDRSEDVAAYLRAVRRIMVTVPGGVAWPIHHSGWLDGEVKKKRERGSSALRGNVDATIYLEVVEDDPDNHRAFLKLSTLKLRDGERPTPLYLIRQRVDVARFDSHGNPMSSCVILRDTRTRADREAERVAEVEAADAELDLKVLRAMRDYPGATSQGNLRAHLGIKQNDVVDSVGRILRAGLAVEGKRGEPYKVTEAGLAHLGVAT